MAIDLLSIPDAAAINYGENDVRHFTEGDAMDVPGISRPTRHLAQRDVAIATKVNEVIEIVNNKEQFVPLPVLRTTLPPNAEEIIQNFRIPPGFECRVLNAIVTSIPASSSAELDIYYTPNSFGNSTGAQIVSTSVEYTGGTQFYSSGEFIITLKNRGGSTLEMIASILLTMRPLGATSAFLLASATIAPSGPPGVAGPPGQAGAGGGVGPAGSPGLAWRSTYNPSTPYGALDVVFWDGSCWKSQASGNTGNTPFDGSTWWEYLAQKGDPGFDWKGIYDPVLAYALNDGVEYLGSSYVCVVTVSAIGHDPVGYPADWDLIAAKGADGFRYRGVWGNPPVDNPSTPYALNDVVNYSASGVTSTYVAINPTVPPPRWDQVPPGNTSWQLMFGAPLTTYGFNTVTGKAYVEADFLPMDGDGPYASIPLSYPGTATTTFTEFKVADAAIGHGLCVLKFVQYARWLGSITLVLPSLSSVPTAATVNWLAADTVLTVNSAGTFTSYGTHPTQVISGAPPVDVPGFVTNGTAVGPRLRQWDDKITITNTPNQASNIYLGLIGFRSY